MEHVSGERLRRKKKERTYLRKPEHANEEDNCPDELNGDRNLPRGVIGTILGSIVENCSEEKADCDCPLITSNDGTANPFGGTFGLVHGDEGGDETDAETGEDTADDEGCEVEGAGLEGDTQAEDEA